MATESDVYDFETPVEAAVKAALETIADLTVYTPANIADDTSGDEDRLQLKRPHVQVMYVHGASLRQRPWIAALSTGDRDAAWSGQIRLDLVTDGKLVNHRAFLAKIRNVMAGLQATVNEVHLPHHCIGWIEDGGATPAVRTEDGYLQTTALFNIKLSVQADAWSSLT